jgi:hypothetical protein
MSSLAARRVPNRHPDGGGHADGRNDKSDSGCAFSLRALGTGIRVCRVEWTNEAVALFCVASHDCVPFHFGDTGPPDGAFAG